MLYTSIIFCEPENDRQKHRADHGSRNLITDGPADVRHRDRHSAGRLVYIPRTGYVHIDMLCGTDLTVDPVNPGAPLTTLLVLDLVLYFTKGDHDLKVIHQIHSLITVEVASTSTAGFKNPPSRQAS